MTGRQPDNDAGSETGGETGQAISANRTLWDGLVDDHLKAPLYDVAGFLAGADRLGPIESREVGDVAGKRLLHLLCRFGLDTLCWARRGATVTGVDIAPKAIAAARDLARQSNLAATFIASDVRTCQPHLTPPYDIVFMSWGALCWLPDMDELARLVAANLAPGGVFYVVDGHPMAGAADEDWSPADGVVRLKWNYQTGRRPDTAIWNNDYAGSNSAAPGLPAHEWAHGLGRIVTALTAAGLVIDFLHEHDVAAWRCMRGLEPATDHMWRLPAGVAQMPLSFSLLARKP